MLEQKGYVKELEKILEGQEHIVYEDCDLYLVDEACLNRVLLLEAKVNRNAKKEGFDEKRSAFYHFGKIINPDHPAIKYNLKKRHKYRATYDRDKIYDDFKENKDKDRFVLIASLKRELEEKIEENIGGKYDGEKAELARKELNDSIEIDMQMLKKVLANFNDYDIVLSNYESYNIYAYLYFTYTDGKKTGLGKNEHLRAKVPNILWIDTDEYYAHRRTDEKIQDIVNTHSRLLGSIYIKKKEVK